MLRLRLSCRIIAWSDKRRRFSSIVTFEPPQRISYLALVLRHEAHEWTTVHENKLSNAAWSFKEANMPNQGYDWRFFPSYRIRKETLDAFLTKKFGEYDFYIEVCEPSSCCFCRLQVLTVLQASRKRQLEILDSTRLDEGMLEV